MGDSKLFINDFTEQEPMETDPDTHDTQGGDRSKSRKKSSVRNLKEEKNTLKEENESLKKNMKMLTEENKTYKHKIAEMTAENESVLKELQIYQPQLGAQFTLIEFLKEIQEENKTFKNELSSSKSLISQMEEDLTKSQHYIQWLKNQSEENLKSATELKTELEAVKIHNEQEKLEMRSTTAKHQSEISMHYKEIVSKIENEKLALQQEISQKKRENQKLDQELKDNYSAYNIDKEQFDAAKKNFETRINKLEKDIRTLNSQKDESDHLASKRQNIITQKEREIWQYQQHIQQLQTDLNNHITTIKSLEKDKKDLTLRLSKLAGANLTYNNPNIADLSDENRPTKLAEEFSELYDNEWTDAFEALYIENEREKTQFMLNILKSVSRLCHDTSRNHMDAIKNSLSTLVLRDLWAEDEDEIPEEMVNGASASTQGDESYTAKTNQKGSENDKEKKQIESDIISETSYDRTDAVNTSNHTVEENAGVYSRRKEGDKNDDGNSNDYTGSKTNEVQNDIQGKPVSGDKPHGERSKPDTSEKNLFGLITSENQDQHGMNAADNINTGTSTENRPADYQRECKGVGADAAGVRKTSVKTTGKCKHGYERDASHVVPDADNNESVKDLHVERSDTAGNEMKKSDVKHSRNKDNKKSGSSKRCSKNRKTSYPITLRADFEELASEQKKTIIEIRKYFEHRLSEQFYKVGSSLIEKEIWTDRDAQESVVKYIEKCMTICWSMCRHEPPVHIEFFETKEDQSYDTNMFKPYTKTGKHMDFVVWPALYLHEGGPMLSKGVAQGRK